MNNNKVPCVVIPFTIIEAAFSAMAFIDDDRGYRGKVVELNYDSLIEIKEDDEMEDN